MLIVSFVAKRSSILEKQGLSFLKDGITDVADAVAEPTFNRT